MQLRPREIKTCQTACFFVAGHDIRRKARVAALRKCSVPPVLWCGMVAVPPRMRRVGIAQWEICAAEKRNFDP